MDQGWILLLLFAGRMIYGWWKKRATQVEQAPTPNVDRTPKVEPSRPAAGRPEWLQRLQAAAESAAEQAGQAVRSVAEVESAPEGQGSPESIPAELSQALPVVSPTDNQTDELQSQQLRFLTPTSTTITKQRSRGARLRREYFSKPKDLRRIVLMNEILKPPLALRRSP